ncbi:hypothetical protein ACWER6_25785 [Streptomyces sp. NPDC004009]
MRRLLAGDGASRVQLTGSHGTGRRMRARSSCHDFPYGDDVNATAHGAWKHFAFTG